MCVFVCIPDSLHIIILKHQINYIIHILLFCEGDNLLRSRYTRTAKNGCWYIPSLLLIIETWPRLIIFYIVYFIVAVTIIFFSLNNTASWIHFIGKDFVLCNNNIILTMFIYIYISCTEYSMRFVIALNHFSYTFSARSGSR